MHKGQMIGTCILIQSMCIFFIFIRIMFFLFFIFCVFFFAPFYILTSVTIQLDHVCFVFFTPPRVLAFVIEVWLC
jgi:hypothetical protein